MQESDDNSTVRINHRKVRSSTTLNRRYIRRPSAADSGQTVKIRRSPSISHFGSQLVNEAEEANYQSDIIEAPVRHPIQEVASVRMAQRSEAVQPVQRASAQELKDQAIKAALASASSDKSSKSKTRKSKAKDSGEHMHFGMGRIALALACAAAAVFVIVYFVNLNMPDISMRVAAMQTGMDPSYPGYIPRGYIISSITSEDNKITMEFTDSSTGGKFTLVEEKSSWDSNALESNYVKKASGDNYTVIREQGLTIFISGSDAAWVNGGILFKIDTVSGTLTNKQIRSIATSL